MATTLSELALHESVLARSRNSFVEVGAALRAIREGKLYKEAGYKTFASYCQEKWEMLRCRAYQLIDAVEAREAIGLSKILDKPIGESQARELAKLKTDGKIDAEKVATAWESAVRRSETEGIPLTAELVRAEVNAILAPSTSPVVPAQGLTLGCTVEDLHKAVADGYRFGTIYADPPWAYGNQATRAATDNHYPTMSIEDIAALPVKGLAADCCHLHLWTTNAFLFECPKLFEAWGFDYQGVFVWTKPVIGLGNCWRLSHEFLVLAIKGEPRKFASDARDLPSWATFDRGEHSSKPDQIRRMVERASPGPRLELFARIQPDGWAAWGNQVEQTMFQKGMESQS